MIRVFLDVPASAGREKSVAPITTETINAAIGDKNLEGNSIFRVLSFVYKVGISAVSFEASRGIVTLIENSDRAYGNIQSARSRNSFW